MKVFMRVTKQSRIKLISPLLEVNMEWFGENEEIEAHQNFTKSYKFEATAHP